MAIYNEYFTVKKLNQYTNAWMQAIKTIYELQSDTTATTEDPRYAAYNTAAELANTVEYESDSENRVYPSTISYGGNYNVLVIRWFSRTYDFYEARLNSTPMTGEIATASQNEYDKQEPVIADPSSQIAPNGKHYSVSDIQSVMNTDNVSLSEAIIKLAGTEKYKKTDTITVKAPDAVTENNKTTVSGQFYSDLDKKKNEQLAKEHPERVVDGVYYADDDALKKAQEAKEARVKEETQQATAEAKANAEKLATTLSTIQKTLYGDNTEAADQLTGTVGGVDLSSALGDVMSIRQRQKLLNFKDFVSDYKEPSTGKPPNNADPFPVDRAKR